MSEAEPTEEPGESASTPAWKDLRAEIAQEPGNHGRFALGCSIVVAVLLVLFFVVRVFVLR